MCSTDVKFFEELCKGSEKEVNARIEDMSNSGYNLLLQNAKDDVDVRILLVNHKGIVYNAVYINGELCQLLKNPEPALEKE